MQKKVKVIIDELALKYGLPVDVITAVVESQFRCARERIATATRGKEETFLNVRFLNLGLLYADHNKIKAIEYARGNRGGKDNDTSRDEPDDEVKENDRTT